MVDEKLIGRSELAPVRRSLKRRSPRQPAEGARQHKPHERQEPLRETDSARGDGGEGGERTLVDERIVRKESRRELRGDAPAAPQAGFVNMYRLGRRSLGSACLGLTVRATGSSSGSLGNCRASGSGLRALMGREARAAPHRLAEQQDGVGEEAARLPHLPTRSHGR